MTKQEEIREIVIVNIVKACPYMLNRDIVKLADKILEDEHSQGVVIKVKRELPNEEDYDYYEDEAFDEGQRSMLDAGYVAVEPLIEGKE